VPHQRAPFRRVAPDPHAPLRRVPPDAVQLQVMLGSLLGDGRLIGAAHDRHMHIAHRADRSDYIRWKYERLVPFTKAPPRRRDDVLEFETITHPIFDDLARLFVGRRAGGPSDAVMSVLRPLGLAVWLADVGRLELRPREFLARQRDALVEPRALALAS
jgi:hypothetical protein